MGIASLKLIKKNKQLVLFPIISGIFLVLVVASFLGILYSSFGLEFDNLARNSSVADYATAFLFYLICYFIIVFFNVGLVHCTRIYLKGEKPSFSDGVKFSMTRLPVIFGWAMLSATVGLILKAIQENSGALGGIIASIVGVVWSIATFFVVPVLAYENVGPFAALKRSSQVMKEKWGESIGASFSFGVLTLLGVLLIALPIGFLFSLVNPVLGVGIGILLVFLIQSIVSSAEMVFIASVYHEIVEDEPVDDFDSELLDDLFVKKEKKGLFG
jgi:hypothetical protein